MIEYDEIQGIYGNLGSLLDVPGTIPPDANVDIVRNGQVVLSQRSVTGENGERITTREVTNRPMVDGEMVEEKRVTVETRAPRTRPT